MKGKLGLVSLSKLKHISHHYPHQLFIVREPGKIDYSKYGLKHVPHLSPSRELFECYMKRWKYGTFTETEQAELVKLGSMDWWDLYVPRFNEEIKYRPDMIRALARVRELLDQGEDVLLVCYCKEETHCHRGILGKHFENCGYEVVKN